MAGQWTRAGRRISTCCSITSTPASYRSTRPVTSRAGAWIARFREFVGDNVLAIDLTQIRGLDDLLQPSEALVEAQELAAEAYGADHTFFLINGIDERQPDA